MGNLDAQRDWGHAKDYVEAMWRILQQDEPEDFVIATGIATSVRDFIRMAFAEMGICIEFKGTGIQERGIIAVCENAEYLLPVGKVVVAVDKNYFRPTEVELLVGDPFKAKNKLGWQPKYSLAMLVHEMMERDIQLFKSYGVNYECSMLEPF